MKLLLLLLLLLLSCDGSVFNNETSPPITNNHLNIYDIWKQNTPLLEDDNGFYHFPYNPTGTSSSDYGTVKYNTALSTTLVNWDSPNEFCIFFQIEMICEPIINFSTYSGSDGYGQQLFYVDSSLIGDTLAIYGSINSDITDSAFVIIE